MTSHINASNSKLADISLDDISRNEENPRILFRQQEFDDLLDSIRRYGVQVPISVYKKKKGYVLIDGERRWRCAIKLNLKTIPALIQDEPSALENILLMFNIHALREQWDLLTIALKLKVIIDLMVKEEGNRPTEIELSKRTGYSRAVIRRCKLLLDLPIKYHSVILKELEKPKSKQKLTEDFFIEMEKALKTVERAVPEVIPDKDKVRQVLISKYRNDVIKNRVHFRQVGKIARAEKIGGDPEKAKVALEQLFANNAYTIETAYSESVSQDYEERDVVQRLGSLIERLREFEPDEVDETLRDELKELVVEAERLLETHP